MGRWTFVALRLVMVGLFVLPCSRAQSPATHPAFEVASIRPHAGGCGFGSLSFEESPGRFTQCNSLSNFIETAYVTTEQDATRQAHRKLQILGGPAWISSFNDLYDITARANGRASDAQMSGPMLRTLLEERFKLKLHRETRQLPVYNLTVAKGGVKLKPLKEGACPAFESASPANLPSRQDNAKALADSLRGVRPTSTPEKCPAVFIDGNGPNTSIDIHGENMAQFAVLLSNSIGQSSTSGEALRELKFVYSFGVC